MSQTSEPDGSAVQALRQEISGLTREVTRVVTTIEHLAPERQEQRRISGDHTTRITALESKISDIGKQKEASWALKAAIIAAVASPLATVILEKMWR